MFESAVEVEKVDEDVPAKAPFHFDLAGLAHSVSKEASMAAHITQLRKHVMDAEHALKTHETHVKDIKELLTKADGEQKQQLSDVLKSAETHVKELKNCG